MKIKENLDYLKNSAFVQNAKERLKPAWDFVFKGKALNIFVFNLLILWILVPVKILIEIVNKFNDILNYSNLFDYIDFNPFSYFNLSTEFKQFKELFSNDITGASLSYIIFYLLVIFIVSLLYLFVSIFFIPNAVVKSSDVCIKENRHVSIGECIKLGFNGMAKFGGGYFIYVLLPLIVIQIIGTIVDFIPGINGAGTASFINSFLFYALMFRYIMSYFGNNGDLVMQQYLKYWGTFAVIAYIVTKFLTYSIVEDSFKIFFMIFTVLLVNNNNYNYDYNNYNNYNNSQNGQYVQ